MTKPPIRRPLPRRDDSRRKRWLASNPSLEEGAERFREFKYSCSGKHKANPYLYGVDPYRGQDSDRTLCDDHAGFGKDDLTRIPALLERAAAACLIGNLIWTVDDTGWIYQLEVTNHIQNEWHGYPLLPSDPFARQVWERFAKWADESGSLNDQNAAKSSALLYGLRR